MLQANFAAMKVSEAAKVALTMGMKTFQHQPCKKCGGTQRRAKGGACVPCSASASSRWYAELTSGTDYYRQMFFDTRIACYNNTRRHAIPRTPKSNTAYWRAYWADMMTVYALRNVLRHFTGDDWEVDHICPTVAIGPYVHEDGRVEWMQIACGLNVPWNMWVIKQRMNKQKLSNFFERICTPSNLKGRDDTCTHKYFQPGDVAAPSDENGVAILAQIDQCMDDFIANIPKGLF